jgi:hypothetical protein
VNVSPKVFGSSLLIAQSSFLKLGRVPALTASGNFSELL